MRACARGGERESTQGRGTPSYVVLMAQARADLKQCRNLSQVLHHTGKLPEAAIAGIVAQLLCCVADEPSGCICPASVWLAEGVATVRIVSKDAPCRIKGGSTEASVPNLVQSTERSQADGARGASVPDDVWAVGALAVECALAIQPADASTVLKGLQDSEGCTPAFLDFVAACLKTTPSERPTPAALRDHEFLVHHAGSTLWLRKDGRVQFHLSKEIVEAGTRYLYSKLCGGDDLAVSSFLTDQSVVVIDNATASGDVVVAASAIQKVSLRGGVLKTVSPEPEHQSSSTQLAGGAQTSWVVTASGVKLDGSVFSHQLTFGIGENSVDELVVERWQIPSRVLEVARTDQAALNNIPSPRNAQTVRKGTPVKPRIRAWPGSKLRILLLICIGLLV